MQKISSGIKSLDALIDSLYVGDNVVWEVEAGTLYHPAFIYNFIKQSFVDAQKTIYVSFNRSPQSILGKTDNFLNDEYFVLIDCFTSGKGKNDSTFLKFYDNPQKLKIIKIDNPQNIEQFTNALNAIQDSLPPGARYVIDSLTGMQDLWGSEDDTYRFFTYMCPRLYDLDTVAYWILEKDAHSQKFKANLRHITQVVLDLYKRRDRLYMKALKIDGREEREAFKPHQYEISENGVTFSVPRKEPFSAIGSRLKDIRMKLGMSQKELAEKVDLTPSFLSQLESNQISPSLSSFMQICNALGVKPSQILDSRQQDVFPWLVKREDVFSQPSAIEDGIKVYAITTNGKLSANIVIFPPGTSLNRHFLYGTTREFIHVLKGKLSVTVEGREKDLTAGDSIYFKEALPLKWINKGGDEAELLVII